MKPTARGCAVLGCLGVVILGTAVAAMVGIHAALVARGTAPPEPEPPPTAQPTAPPIDPRPRTRTPAPVREPTAAPDPDHFLSRPGEARQFTRKDDGPRYVLRYGFVDYGGRRHDLICTVGKSALKRARESFGWDTEEIKAELNAELQKTVDHELDRRGLAPHMRVVVEGYGGWRSESTGSNTAGDRTIQEIVRFQGWLRGDLDRIRDEAEARTFKRRGLLVRNHTVEIDYNAVARQATPDLQDCYDALVQAAGEATSDRYFMGLLVAFFQELQYELPPDKLGKRDTLGFWVPAQVMTDGKGDCDSKSVAFASLWRKRQPRVLVISVPEHALVAVEGKPGPGEEFVRVGNRYYVLCEVAGPGKTPPGRNSISGSFEYVAIDPES